MTFRPNYRSYNIQIDIVLNLLEQIQLFRKLSNHLSEDDKKPKSE